MLIFDINFDESKKIIYAKLSGKFGNEAEIKDVMDQFLSGIENHKWFNLILDVSELEMPGLQAFSMLGRLKEDVDEAAKSLKKIAVVDNGKVTDMMSAFFMKPPPNMFFDSMDTALEFICRD